MRTLWFLLPNLVAFISQKEKNVRFFDCHLLTCSMRKLVFMRLMQNIDMCLLYKSDQIVRLVTHLIWYQKKFTHFYIIKWLLMALNPSWPNTCIAKTKIAAISLLMCLRKPICFKSISLKDIFILISLFWLNLFFLLTHWGRMMHIVMIMDMIMAWRWNIVNSSWQ